MAGEAVHRSISGGLLFPLVSLPGLSLDLTLAGNRPVLVAQNGHPVYGTLVHHLLVGLVDGIRVHCDLDGAASHLTVAMNASASSRLPSGLRLRPTRLAALGRASALGYHRRAALPIRFSRVKGLLSQLQPEGPRAWFGFKAVGGSAEKTLTDSAGSRATASGGRSGR